MIVGTVTPQSALPDAIPFVQVQHMLTETERQQLRAVLENPGGTGCVSDLVNALVTAAARYAPDAKEELQQTFHALVGHFLCQTRSAPLSARPAMLADYLHQRVQFCGRQLSWRQAIRLAAQPLVNDGVVSTRYASQIVRHIEQSGVTIYLTPQVLLLHSVPPENISSGALSLLKMKHPLDFGRFAATLSPLLIVILVPSHDLSHIAMLEALNGLLGDDSALASLLQASSLSGVLKCITR